MSFAISIVKNKHFDVSQILDIQVEGNLSKWSAEDYKNEIIRNDSILLAAKNNGETVGFLLARFVGTATETIEYGELDILNFGVFKKFRKQGVGNLLFEYLLDKFNEDGLRSIWLEVRESNVEAIRFYKNRGFRAIQTRRNFYRQPLENAIVMKWLQKPADRKIFNKT